MGPAVGERRLRPGVGGQRIDVVALGLAVEQRHQLLQLFGILCREVMGLTVIHGQVVKLPGMLIHRGLVLPGQQVAGTGPPAVLVDAPVAHHLEILDRMG